ncbi:MAG: hypothetical protein N3G74_00020 [Candidatus Micrarchaeota archaeon]|nr:hypothetical protein [Candidatus Micrarchaeota archaeon]
MGGASKKITAAVCAGTAAVFLATSVANLKFEKLLKTESFITAVCKDKLMSPVRQKEKTIPFNQIVEPTSEIKKKANEIAKTAKDENEAIKLSLKVIDSFSFMPRSETAFPQTPSELEKSKKGDCNEFAIYLYSLLKEVENFSNFKFNPKFVEVYVTKEREHVNHMALQIDTGKGKIFVDPLSKKKIGVEYLVYRVLDEKQFIASYYADAATYHWMNGKLKEAEKNFKIAIKNDPSSPTAIYGLSKVYSYTENNELALKYAQQLLRLQPNWSHAHLRIIQVYYDEGNYNEMKKAVKKLEEIDPNNKFIKMYNGIIERYELFNSTK